MIEVLRFLLGLAAAVSLHVFGLRLHGATPQFFDPFVVLVIYGAMRSGTSRSTVSGSVVGLVQDTLTGGLYGLHGFANTAVAYLISAVRQRFVIQQPLQIAVLAALGGIFQTLVLAFLQWALVTGSELPELVPGLIKMIVTGLATLAVYVGSNRLFAWDLRRRELRNSRIRLGL